MPHNRNLTPKPENNDYRISIVSAIEKTKQKTRDRLTEFQKTLLIGKKGSISRAYAEWRANENNPSLPKNIFQGKVLSVTMNNIRRGGKISSISQKGINTIVRPTDRIDFDIKDNNIDIVINIYRGLPSIDTLKKKKIQTERSNKNYAPKGIFIGGNIKSKINQTVINKQGKKIGIIPANTIMQVLEIDKGSRGKYKITYQDPQGKTHQGYIWKAYKKSKNGKINYISQPTQETIGGVENFGANVLKNRDKILHLNDDEFVNLIRQYGYNGLENILGDTASYRKNTDPGFWKNISIIEHSPSNKASTPLQIYTESQVLGLSNIFEITPKEISDIFLKIMWEESRGNPTAIPQISNRENDGIGIAGISRFFYEEAKVNKPYKNNFPNTNPMNPAKAIDRMVKIFTYFHERIESIKDNPVLQEQLSKPNGKTKLLLALYSQGEPKTMIYKNKKLAKINIIKNRTGRKRGTTYYDRVIEAEGMDAIQ